MTKIKVEYFAIDTLANDIDLARVKIDLDLANLKTEVQQLTAAWEGAAADAYVAAQQDWDEAAQSLRDVLVAVSKLLTQASNSYSSTEDKLAAAW